MKFSLSWLEKHINFMSGIGINDIVDGLTGLGLEVEKVDDPSKSLKGFIIAEILDVRIHPNADRLNICKVNIGNKNVEVVCGAKNVRKNLKVAFAPIGSLIPSSKLVLKKKEIRGFTGEGMLCSGEELCLEKESEGILELSDNYKAGTFLNDLDEFKDAIIEIGLTPNRGDCASVVGVARELAALGLGNLKKNINPDIKSSFVSPIKWNIKLPEKHKTACSFVSGRYFKGLKNNESPQWLKKKLISIGLRPISILVDLTNYLTYDLGRPLHVFDAKKIKGNLTIRMAKKKEKIKALDGKDYELNDEILIIEDEKAVVSIAGVIGGEDSSCDMNTTEMFLESAMFDPIYVSNSGRKLNILSDARYRFERGVDPAYVLDGLDFMTDLVLELCGGEVSEVVSAGKINKNNYSIKYHYEKVNKLSGINFSKDYQVNTLLKLGFDVKKSRDYCELITPSWRHDVKDEIDIVEEIIRLNGYDNIENIELPHKYKNKSVLNISEIRQRLIRNSLIKSGLYEAVTFSFLSKNDMQFFTEEDVFMELDNPISEELSIMRNTLLPNLINNFLNNINKGLKNIGLFEVGAIYLGDSFDDQHNSAAGIRSGMAGKRHWSENARNVDLYDAKKDIYTALASLGININNIFINRKTPKWYHPGRSGSINLGKSVLGYFGELHPSITKQYGIQMVAFEIFPDNLPASFKIKNNKQFEKYNLMPIKRDFSFFINLGTTSLEIQDTIKTTLKNNNLIELMEINIFDLYNNPSKEGTTSIAFEIIMQPKVNTLNDNQIKNISDTIVENIKEKNNAILKD